MCPGSHVPQILSFPWCKEGSLFPGFYVPRVLLLVLMQQAYSPRFILFYYTGIATYHAGTHSFHHCIMQYLLALKT